jgi:serine/threonine-protein kinase HipA
MKEKLEPISRLHVEIDVGDTPQLVGRLAWQRGRSYFEYAPSFLERGRSISPLKLPLEPRVFMGEPEPFEGLHGVFNDSLPDGWGRLLLDRTLARRGILPSALSPLDRLAYVGSRGLGALRYRPEHEQERSRLAVDLDALAAQVRTVVDGDSEEVLDHLLDLGGSSGGARPKVLIGVNADRKRILAGVDALPPGYAHWIVKFRSSSDPPDVGAIEYAYSEMARAADIDLPPTHLFPARKGAGYFGVQRFDRRGNTRVHVHSVCGLLHADFRVPSIGYKDLLNVTRLVTKSQIEVDKMFRRMVFNVFAHNRDDHTKNHAFLLENDGEWRCSPAYDVTFSSGLGGEHTLDVDGEGRQPGIENISAVAQEVGVNDKSVRACVDQVKEAVNRWPEFAAKAGVSRRSGKDIDALLNGPRRGPKPRRAVAHRAPGTTRRR